jgi:hypothetical protein
VKAVSCAIRECATYSHSYLSGEIKVEENTVQVAVGILIVYMFSRLYGDAGGTREA